MGKKAKIFIVSVTKKKTERKKKKRKFGSALPYYHKSVSQLKKMNNLLQDLNYSPAEINQIKHSIFEDRYEEFKDKIDRFVSETYMDQLRGQENQ